MEVIRFAYVDWEPLHLELLHVGAPRQTKGRIRRLMEEFLAHRAASGICRCSDKSLGVRSGNRGRITVTCEWMCEECLRVLCSMIASSVPEVTRVEIGHELEEDPGLPAARVDVTAYVKVTARAVDIEGHSIQIPQAFMIATSPVTVRLFGEFVADTGYVTEAEHNGDRQTFRDNAVLLPFTEQARQSKRATCLCFLDARAYCDWAGVRLPNEAEWLAAAMRYSEKLHSLDTELVSAWDNPGSPVIRRGTSDSQRLACGTKDYDLVLGFRVVSGCPGPADLDNRDEGESNTV